MKSFIALAVLLIGFSSMVHAEDSASATSFATPLAAGHWQISGSAGWTSINDSDAMQLYVAPRAEYFLCDHVSLGGGLGFYMYKNPYSNNPGLKLRYVDVSPSVTMYFTTAAIAPYVTQRLNVGMPDYAGVSYGGTTGAGVAFFMNQHVSIAPELDATYAQYTRGDLSLNVRIGVYL